MASYIPFNDLLTLFLRSTGSLGVPLTESEEKMVENYLDGSTCSIVPGGLTPIDLISKEYRPK